MTSESEELISSDSDLETNTRDLLSELGKLGEGIDDSPSIIPPTPQKKKGSGEASSSVFRRLSFGATGLNQAKNRTRTDHAVEKGTKQPQKQTTTDCAASSHSFTGSGSVQPTSRIGGAHSDILEILAEVKKTNSKLTEYGERLETLEQRVGSIEQKTHETPTSSSSCSHTAKTKIPPEVRVCLFAFTNHLKKSDMVI